MTKNNHHEASFRDPSGYMFFDNDVLRRAINPIYFEQYEALNKSGLFNALVKKGLLIPHQETEVSSDKIVITPEPIPFITNPYEWSFEQYKHAALLTLQIQKFALSRGFILKDASAYNVTFHKGKPVFIDTLSFDFYEEGSPWRAFKQFIMHFFGPLVLAHYHGAEILKMMQTHIDGIPLKLIVSLLPGKSRFSSTLYTNIHLLAKLESKHSDDYKAETKIAKLSKKAQNNMLENLFNYIKKMDLKESSEWGDYYDKTNYNTDSFNAKKELIRSWVKPLAPQRLIDVGGNDGTFARTVIEEVPHVIVTDIDSNAVAHNYLQARDKNEENMLAFVCDVLQPAPGIGFNNTERESLIERLQNYAPDITMALALIHHITLSGNVPFEKSAEFFAKFSKYLIIEFPKREDSWVESLLVRKREFINHFDFYNEKEFEKGYLKYFTLEKKEEIKGTQRVLYLLKRS
ncbi:MAG: class I SAM-dependent methyltransferase [Bacteroidia bacterium]|nr:class I SAM-dependent methyltransferase [Bacteroidia bacterium]MBT8276930.1 class I SAM-dependent methyltransferase [Bacteroidia bacterium]NNF32288.1 class I SAM-dependent methyltransferase [Flavobacteriaceae bacterium]NNK53753.1 class I SAM-dependent methyltransferase [Flavobacteriaceae bacterium]NNM10056.1 class I SAM-dependent methyltransferase [Flavobacteriaceae bacterium]